MYLKEKDRILTKINKVISKEKETEHLRISTVWFYRCLAMISLVVMIVCITIIGTYSYREFKLLNNHENDRIQLQNQIDTLTKQLEEANKIITTQSTLIEGLENSITTKDKTIADLEDYNSNLSKQLEDAESNSKSLATDLKTLNDDYQKLTQSYNVLAERKELYDKYEYALMYEGERTDLTYDMCAYGEQLMLDYYLDPDLLFAIGMVESHYDEDCINSESTATGFHQFLDGTGEWVYESLGYTEPYNHVEVQTDGYKSIECAAWYLHYLYSVHDEDIMKVIEGYRGIKNPTSYIDRINKYLATKDKSVDDIDDFIEFLYEDAVG